jgi:mannose/cellobiose epimerase-like protein (N-acyl-D-glucosamine 2-epimerase family)
MKWVTMRRQVWIYAMIALMIKGKQLRARLYRKCILKFAARLGEHRGECHGLP